MANVTLFIEDEVLEVLTTRAQSEGVSVEVLIRGMLEGDFDEIRQRLNDPIIGALGPFTAGKGPSDVASRADEIIRDEWEPE